MNIQSKQPRSTLQHRTGWTLFNAFADWRHYPSREMLKDLLDTAGYLEQMAGGHLSAKYYLNSLATGVGKTTLIISFVGELVESLEHKDVGVIICVPLKEEIEQIIRDLTTPNLNPKECVHVYTSDDAINALGCKDGNSAQVLITTQQMVGSRLANGKPFAALDYFHFKGKPRIVKIWDEALIPWEELVLDVDEIGRLPKLFRHLNRDLADKLYEISEEIRKAKNGSAYTFPDLGITMDDLRRDIFAANEEADIDRKAARTLCKVSGKDVRVVQDPWGGASSVTWKNNLPDDFMPVVVFDASGRVRTLYERYGKASGQLQEITSATKSYDNVTFWHVDMGGSKNQWRKNASRLLEATAEIINDEPDRSCLVVHTLPDKYKAKDHGAVPDIPKALADYLKKPANVRYRNWGRHRQTNEFRDFDKIILAGLWYLPTKVIAARARGAMQMDNSADLALKDFRDIEIGELKNDILQAVGRICVRKCIGDQAPKADVYVIASNKAGTMISELLKETFPGCTVRAYRPAGAPRQKWELALDHMSEHFKTEAFVSFATLMKSLGIKNKPNFNRIRDNKEFKRELKAWNIAEASMDNGRYFTGFRKHLF